MCIRENFKLVFIIKKKNKRNYDKRNKRNNRISKVGIRNPKWV